MTQHKPKPRLDDPALLAALLDIFEERVPFNKVVGMKVVSLDPAAPVFRFDMRPELVGNFMRGMLHGGVISAVLDVACGAGVLLRAVEKHLDQGETIETQIGRFARIGTIDLRIDYLRPGLGAWFVAKVEVMRSGNRVAVVRSELRNDSDELIAIAVGAYTAG